MLTYNCTRKSSSLGLQQQKEKALLLLTLVPPLRTIAAALHDASVIAAWRRILCCCGLVNTSNKLSVLQELLRSSLIIWLIMGRASLTCLPDISFSTCHGQEESRQQLCPVIESLRHPYSHLEMAIFAAQLSILCGQYSFFGHEGLHLPGQLQLHEGVYSTTHRRDWILCIAVLTTAMF